jgi:putative ABC transport system permease protein
MYSIALKMLLGDRGKYLGIVMGIALASFLMMFQPGIMLKMLAEHYSRITSISLPDIWVMDPKVHHVQDSKPLTDTQLYRVRSVKDVEWAMPLHQGNQMIRTSQGELVPCALLGVDDATLIGAPAAMVQGKYTDLRTSDGVIIEESSAQGRLAKPPLTPGGPSVPLTVGDTFEINDKRAVVVGIAKPTAPEDEAAVVYTTYTRVKTYARNERKFLTYILVKGKQGVPLEEVTRRITRDTGLAAHTADEFKSMTIRYMANNTPIIPFFALIVSVGFVVGALVTGQIFYNFTIDNLRYFGVFKAMGTTDNTLRRMIFLQAGFVGITGFGLGAGIVGLFAYFTQGNDFTVILRWELLAACAMAVLPICILAALISIRKVMKLEPAAVFNG